jgi:hypothetical protein
MEMKNSDVIDATRRWIADVVVGLNLCPFARRVFDAGLIRYVVTETADPAVLLNVLAEELATLAGADRSRTETTLLIHPRAVPDFLDFNDFLADAEGRVRDLGLRGVIQIASFHPHYCFADTDPDAVENYTNRSPFPMLHLLREESVSEVAGDPDALPEIPRRNVKTLKGLGRERMREKLRAIDAGFEGQSNSPMKK